MKFDAFDLDERCLEVLQDMGIESPTPVQEMVIPVALRGMDLIATAQTGTGKTLGYVLPSLTRLAAGKKKRNRMLVLTPTRELCVQVESVVREFSKALDLRSVQVYGGVGLRPQANRLKRGCDVVVATPGRLLDHMGRRNVKFGGLEILVLDEADRMLDMGFLPDIQRILKQLPVNRQTMMLSATFPHTLERLAGQMMRDPERLAVGQLSMPVESVRQELYPVRPENKSRVLMDVLKIQEIDSALIFLRTKQRTDRVGRMLKKAGYNAAIIHGDLSQKDRQKALEGFRSGKYNILVATDVAARGLDIEGISHVINYDIPPTADDYIHRIGRTARAKREGDAITFVSPTEHSALAAIESALEKHLPRKELEGAPLVLSTWNAAESPVAKRHRKGRSMLRRRR